MATIALPSGTVHYTDSGAGAPIVLLHANPGDSRDYDAVLPALVRLGRVLALDWPGYGASPAPAEPQQLAHDFHARLLREFVDALALDRLVLIGNSLGGTVALQFALAAPQRVRQLVLVAPGGFTRHNVVTRFFGKLQSSRWALPPHRWASLYLRVRTQWTQAMLQRARTSQASASALAVNRATWRLFTQASYDMRQRAVALSVPTLLICGQHDPAVPAARDGEPAARTMPTARLLVLPCGHAAFAELPQLFLDAVLPFLMT